MTQIKRKAIDTDVRLIAITLLTLFPTVMTGLAQRLQGASAEGGEVAVVRHDVVDGSGRNDEAEIGAQAAEGFGVELHEASPLPPVAAVQATVLGAGGHATTLRHRRAAG